MQELQLIFRAGTFYACMTYSPSLHWLCIDSMCNAQAIGHGFSVVTRFFLLLVASIGHTLGSQPHLARYSKRAWTAAAHAQAGSAAPEAITPE